MIKRLVIGLAAIGAVGCAGYARVERGYVTTPASTREPIAFTVDSIDFRKDLTRVYGRLTGRPHTSNRIDAATLVTPRGTFTATDIDGIDFERYFQWEDEGVIPVEIDFAPSAKPSAIKLKTVRGEATVNISKNRKKK